MYDVHSGIKMSNHVEQGSTYSNCFSGETLNEIKMDKKVDTEYSFITVIFFLPWYLGSLSI